MILTVAVVVGALDQGVEPWITGGGVVGALALVVTALVRTFSRQGEGWQSQGEGWQNLLGSQNAQMQQAMKDSAQRVADLERKLAEDQDYYRGRIRILSEENAEERERHSVAYRSLQSDYEKLERRLHKGGAAGGDP